MVASIHSKKQERSTEEDFKTKDSLTTLPLCRGQLYYTRRKKITTLFCFISYIPQQTSAHSFCFFC